MLPHKASIGQRQFPRLCTVVALPTGKVACMQWNRRLRESPWHGTFNILLFQSIQVHRGQSLPARYQRWWSPRQMWWIPKVLLFLPHPALQMLCLCRTGCRPWPIPSNLRPLPDKFIPTNVLIADGFALLISEELNKITLQSSTLLFKHKTDRSW